MKDRIKYFVRKQEFAYPDENGKTKMLSFNMIVEEKDKDNFDKFMNVIRSVAKQSGLKEFKIYE